MVAYIYICVFLVCLFFLCIDVKVFKKEMKNNIKIILKSFKKDKSIPFDMKGFGIHYIGLKYDDLKNVEFSDKISLCGKVYNIHDIQFMNCENVIYGVSYAISIPYRFIYKLREKFIDFDFFPIIELYLVCPNSENEHYVDIHSKIYTIVKLVDKKLEKNSDDISKEKNNKVIEELYDCINPTELTLINTK